MRNLADTIARLSAFRGLKVDAGLGSAADHLLDLGAFGSNPGALTGRYHVPASAKGALPLVVVLHGCKQTAAGYDAGTGWSRLADEAGFAVLYAEQGQQNNLNRCFNWFQPGDAGRDQGEALSIRQMIEATAKRHPIDRRRIYITGLSAGGAMASVMLASYPELFAGGAIIAGLPFGVAATVPGAFDAMRAHGLPDGAALRARLPREAPAGGWPRISVWHGTADQTVAAANADAIVEQWRGVHGASKDADEVSRTGRQTRRIWRDRAGRPVIDQVLIGGMGHGTPIDGTGPEALGTPAPFILDVGISSTRRIAAHWGIAEAIEAVETRARAEASVAKPGVRTPAADDIAKSREMPKRAEQATPRTGSDAPASTGIRKVIEDALRQAGLM